jgi:hypothetical protein
MGDVQFLAVRVADEVPHGNGDVDDRAYEGDQVADFASSICCSVAIHPAGRLPRRS